MDRTIDASTERDGRLSVWVLGEPAPRMTLEVHEAEYLIKVLTLLVEDAKW
jgi:hypothetical protein